MGGVIWVFLATRITPKKRNVPILTASIHRQQSAMIADRTRESMDCAQKTMTKIVVFASVRLWEFAATELEMRYNHSTRKWGGTPEEVMQQRERRFAKPRFFLWILWNMKTGWRF